MVAMAVNDSITAEMEESIKYSFILVNFFYIINSIVCGFICTLLSYTAAIPVVYMIYSFTIMHGFLVPGQ